MSSFESPAVTLPAAPPDPRKHVNYSLGMVLGVDDFTQEFAYLSARDQLLARELLGYGTVCGLRVTIEPADDDAERFSNPQLRVGPGLAVTPRGQLVGVPAAQCAVLKTWLTGHTQDIEARVGKLATTTLPLYLVLCYRDCLTDQVPIPGESCRDDDAAFAASRLTDDFKLDLLFAPPEQREEDALRDFVQWLNQVPIAEASDSSPVGDTGFADEAAWERAIRDAAFVLSSPPSSPPDFMYGAPPADLRVRAEDACAFLRVAFRLWTTELRPIFLGHGQTCAGDPPDEGCVLLADLSVPLVAGSLGGEVTIDEARRPYLLHLRLIQEWLICGRREIVPSDLVVTETEFGQEPSAGISERYSRADHTHGSPALGGDIAGTAGDLVVERLRGIEVVYDVDGPQAGQVLTFVPAGSTPVEGEEAGGTWQAQDLPELDGDVTGPLDETSVQRILGAQVIYARNTPSEGQVLKFTRGAWRPGRDDSGLDSIDMKGDVGGTTDANRIERLQDIPVDAKTPKPKQVLTYVEDTTGKHWVPADGSTGGDAVIHPPGLPDYAIVAAGAVLPDGVRRATMYNGLVAKVLGAGLIQVTFDKYEPPNKSFAYIVKALPVFDEETRKMLQDQMPTIAFHFFDNAGFTMIVFVAGKPLDNLDMLSRVRLMIEVSRYAIAG